MSYEERQAEWAKKHDVKVGDRVRLIRAASNEEDGWPRFWPRSADGWIGNILGVGSIGALGIMCYNHDADDWFCFPYFVLEKVMEHKDKEWTVSYGLKVKTGDPVLVRDDEDENWRYALFSDVLPGDNNGYRYRTCGLTYTHCIPYKGYEHLTGTTDAYVSEKKESPKFVFGAKVKAMLSSGEEMEGVLIGFDEEDDDTPFEVAVLDEDAELGRIRYWAKSVTYVD